MHCAYLGSGGLKVGILQGCINIFVMKISYCGNFFCKKWIGGVCALRKGVLQSHDFTVNRVLMKLVKSSNTTVIEQCRSFFRIKVPAQYHLTPAGAVTDPGGMEG